MSVSISKEKIDLGLRLHEAEVYYSMGLLGESLRTYEQILLDIRERITALRKESGDPERKEATKMSSEELSIIKEVLTSHENVSEILDSASAFTELSLFKEAIAEYEKLFQTEYSNKRIVSNLVECFFKIYTPFEVIGRVDKIINEQGLTRQEKANVKFDLGREMEKRDHKHLSIDLYKSAGEMDPENGEIKDKLNSVLANLAYRSRYDYLINEKVVTIEQLQKALAISKKMEKSVEFILIEQFKIKKEEVGKSLSLFYGCHFKNFDPEVPIPVELISNLKKSFLLQSLWVPLAGDKGGVEVLIDDPRNLSKTDYIGALLKTKKIKLSVGIKEDIEAFINHFFDHNKPAVQD